MSDRKIRFSLFGGALLVLLIVFVFIWIVNVNQIDANIEAFKQYMSILGGLAVASLAFFFTFAQVRDENGKIYASSITTMLVTLLMIVQMALAVSTYTAKSMSISFESFEKAYSVVDVLDQSPMSEYNGILSASTTEQYDYMAVVDPDSTVVYSSDPDMIGKKHTEKASLSFILYSGDDLIVRSSDAYHTNAMTELILSQLTLLVVSLLFSVEFVMFIVERISLVQDQKSGIVRKQPAVLSSVRQIAFIFYFASRLSACFIPVMAKSLPSGFLSLSPNMIAALPQTAETFTTCIAILLTNNFITKTGWKPSFSIGLSLVILGTLLSAFSQTLTLFSLARALVGLGYGFCWMTLRSVSLFAEDDASRMRGFSMLNAGIYAGMYCGSTVGSIIASSFGYVTVLYISSALILICGFFISSIENRRVPVLIENTENTANTSTIDWRKTLNFISYIILLIAPSCLVVAYSGYFLPLYYDQIGRGTLDVGRAQLLYGLIIVYIGPLITSYLVRKRVNLISMNYLYIILLAAGLILLGVFGGFAVSLITISLIAVADSFGFGMQNNYFLNLSISKRLGGSRSLTYLSLTKKLLEMFGPSVFAIAMTYGATGTSLMNMGFAFILAVVVFAVIRFLARFSATRGLE